MLFIFHSGQKSLVLKIVHTLFEVPTGINGLLVVSGPWNYFEVRIDQFSGLADGTTLSKYVSFDISLVDTRTKSHGFDVGEFWQSLLLITDNLG